MMFPESVGDRELKRFLAHSMNYMNWFMVATIRRNPDRVSIYMPLGRTREIPSTINMKVTLMNHDDVKDVIVRIIRLFKLVWPVHENIYKPKLSREEYDPDDWREYNLQVARLAWGRDTVRFNERTGNRFRVDQICGLVWMFRKWRTGVDKEGTDTKGETREFGIRWKQCMQRCGVQHGKYQDITHEKSVKHGCKIVKYEDSDKP